MNAVPWRVPHLEEGAQSERGGEPVRLRVEAAGIRRGDDVSPQVLCRQNHLHDTAYTSGRQTSWVVTSGWKFRMWNLIPPTWTLIPPMCCQVDGAQVPVTHAHG